MKQSIIIFNITNFVLKEVSNPFNINNPYFEEMINQIHPPELQFNNANTSDTEAPFLDF